MPLALATSQPLIQMGQPFNFGESGFQGTNEHNDGHLQDPTGKVLQQQAWAGILLGGYSTSMNWWWDVYIDNQQTMAAVPPHR